MYGEPVVECGVISVGVICVVLAILKVKTASTGLGSVTDERLTRADTINNGTTVAVV